MLCNNFKAQYSHFRHCRKPNVPTSSQNKRKQTTSIFSTRIKIFTLFLLAAAKSEVISYGLNGKKY